MEDDVKKLNKNATITAISVIVMTFIVVIGMFITGIIVLADIFKIVINGDFNAIPSLAIMLVAFIVLKVVLGIFYTMAHNKLETFGK